MDAAATERDWFNLQGRSRLVLAKGMFLRLTIGCCLASVLAAQDNPQSATREIAAAANEFVATLDESRQGNLIYDFMDEAQRKRWSYFRADVQTPVPCLNRLKFSMRHNRAARGFTDQAPTLSAGSSGDYCS